MKAVTAMARTPVNPKEVRVLDLNGIKGLFSDAMAPHGDTPQPTKAMLKVDSPEDTAAAF